MYSKHMKKVIACGTYLYTMVRGEVPTYLITFQGANTLFDRILVSWEPLHEQANIDKCWLSSYQVSQNILWFIRNSLKLHEQNRKQWKPETDTVAVISPALRYFSCQAC